MKLIRKKYLFVVAFAIMATANYSNATPAVTVHYVLTCSPSSNWCARVVLQGGATLQIDGSYVSLIAQTYTVGNPDTLGSGATYTSNAFWMDTTSANDTTAGVGFVGPGAVGCYYSSASHSLSSYVDTTSGTSASFNSYSNWYTAAEDYEGSVATAINEKKQTLNSESLILSQNYPNPFSGNTSIDFGVLNNNQIGKELTLSIMNLTGNVTKVLYEGTADNSTHNILINSENLPSGDYFYILKSGSLVSQKILTITK